MYAVITLTDERVELFVDIFVIESIILVALCFKFGQFAEDLFFIKVSSLVYKCKLIFDLKPLLSVVLTFAQTLIAAFGSVVKG